MASATLGEPSSSIATDRVLLHEIGSASNAHSKQAIEHSSYTVSEIVSSGVTVREFVSDSGTVFAIAWQGEHHPDFVKLMGTYASEIKSAKPNQVKIIPRRARTIRTPHLVLEHSGFSTSFQGRAYDPELLPSGINLNEIK